MKRCLAVLTIMLCSCVAHWARFLPETGLYEDTASSLTMDGGGTERYLVVRDVRAGVAVTLYGDCGSRSDGGTQVRLTGLGGDGGWILDDGLVEFPIPVENGDSWVREVVDPRCTLVSVASDVSSSTLTLTHYTRCEWGESVDGEERWELDRGRVSFRIYDAGFRSRRIGPIPPTGKCVSEGQTQ